jgi:hypothetical protein
VRWVPLAIRALHGRCNLSSANVLVWAQVTDGFPKQPIGGRDTPLRFADKVTTWERQAPSYSALGA